MHFLSIKEQLVLLKINRISYKGLKHYLLYQYQSKLVLKKLSFDQINQLVGEMKKVSLIERNFKIIEYHYNYIHLLASKTIIYGEQVYPKLWYQIEQPPVLMFYEGNLNLLKRPLISMVGTRNITSYGKKVTEELVNCFSRYQWTVVSGMAKGVDAAVHQTTIKSQDSLSTIAIIATGLNQVYPKDHRDLQSFLGKTQLVLSEYLPDQGPQKHHFIMRNRLVAGISPVTCVIEAAKKSGSLITANYALQFNREVYALPGRITDTQSEGCNELIEAGARPILSYNQVANEINELFVHQNQ